MNGRETTPAARLPRLIAPAIVLVGVAISAVLWFALHVVETDSGIAIARKAAGEIARTLTEAFHQRSQALERMAMRWHAADGTPEKLWRADALAYHKTSPGELAIGRADAAGTIVWIEPTAGNEKAIGFELRSEPIRRATFDWVKASKSPSVATAIHLAQGGYGFIFMYPLYRQDGTFDGVITSVYRAQEAIQALVDPAAYHLLKFELRSTGAVLSSVRQEGLNYLDDVEIDVPIAFLDQQWELGVTPSQEFLDLHATQLPITVAIVAFAFSLLFAMLTEQWIKGYEREEKLRSLSQELKHRQDIIDTVAMVGETEPDGTITYVNDLMVKCSGFARSELIGNTHRLLRSGIHPPEFFGEMWRTIRQGKVWRGEIQNVTKTGEPQWYDTTIVPTVGPDGTISKYTAIRFDLTPSILADIRLKAAISVMESGFALFDADDRLVLYNDGFIEPTSAAIYGEPRGKTFEEIIRAFSAADLTAVEAIHDREAWIKWRVDLHRNPPGHPIEIEWTDGRWMRVTERRTEDGGWVGIWTDITEQKEREAGIRHEHKKMEQHAQKLTELAEEIELSRQEAENARRQSEFMALHDALTGLPNRRSFQARLATEGAAQDGRGYAILFVDLDKFKTVNDTLGHDAGDDLLKLVADKLRGSVRDQDFIARLGGDEFAILMTAPPALLRERAAILGRRILDNLQIPVPAPTGVIQVGCTIGIAVTPGDADTLEALVTLADQLMYVGKKQGKNRLITTSDVPDLGSVQESTRNAS